MAKRLPPLKKPPTIQDHAYFVALGKKGGRAAADKHPSRPWRRRPLADRFWEKVDKNGPLPAIEGWTRGQCWLFIGAWQGGGYGSIRADADSDEVVLKAHVVSLQLAGRSIEAGMVVDHLCRVKNCVRPDHLEVVTFQENVLRGIGPTADNARREFCACGQPLEKLWASQNRRDCRVCFRRRCREASRRRQERKRAAREGAQCQSDYLL